MDYADEELKFDWNYQLKINLVDLRGL